MQTPVAPIVIIGKLLSAVSRLTGAGAGATWPGEIAINLRQEILKDFSSQLREGIIIVAGTNGKTTTSLMIKKILEDNGKKVIHNGSGANLLNGVVSAFLEKSSLSGKIDADWAVLETDENSLPVVVKYSQSPEIIVVFLNLFRDQLDRYGEVDVIAEKWETALAGKDRNLKVIANADDPLVAHLSKGRKTFYFGVNEPSYYLKKMEHATDSIFCLNCGNRLTYKGLYYSHIGLWHCENCGEKRPEPKLSKWESPLPGLYNLYNTLAAVSVARYLKISDSTIENSLKNFAPAFGRQEEFDVEDKKVKIFLSKNPAGFNESLRTILRLGAKNILFVLNDRIPDGRDVSWIWDVDFENMSKDIKLFVTGDRIFDMALRIKYAGLKAKVEPNLGLAIEAGLMETTQNGTLYILPTYSAMLEVRELISGKKIL